MAKYLFFLQGMKPTTAEATAITRLSAKGHDVKVRNSAHAGAMFGDHGREACDGVAGTVPTGYGAVKASLQFENPGVGYDGVLEATTAGAAGNSVTVRLKGDSAGGAGV